MSEFTGKSREIFRVSVTMERQRQVEHKTEGWINLPGDKPETLHKETVAVTDKLDEAMTTYERLVEK